MKTAAQQLADDTQSTKRFVDDDMLLKLKIEVRVRQLEVAAARLWLDLVKASARE